MAAAARSASSAPEARGDDYQWADRRIRRALERHDKRCERYAKREDSWLAARASDQESRQRVRFAYQRIDTLMAYITAEKPIGRVKPMVPGEKCAAAAKLMDKAMGEWYARDHRDEKQVELALTACIYGNAPAKVIWDYERATETKRSVKRNLMGTARIVAEQVEVTLRDQPGLVTLDPCDFAWDPSCTDLDDAEYAIQFSYPTIAQLKQGAREGRYFNIDEVQPINSATVETYSRPGRRRDLQGRVEVIEVWAKGRLVTVANRQACIRAETSVFEHHQLPFVVCSTMPSLYTLDGSSEVEVISAIQAEMHDFRHQYLLNARLANKLIVLLEGDARDVDKFNTALLGDNPVSVLPVENAGVPPTTWAPAAPLIQMGQSVMEGLEKEMDDISGIGPYVSGATEQSVDPKTATEVSTLQGASMRRITAKRNQLNRGYQRIANMDLQNARQLMTRPLAIRIDEGDSWSWDYVDPQEVVDADLEYVIKNADESIDEEQKRTEANNRLQTALAAAQIMAPLGQPVPNLAKEYMDFLEAYGVLNPADYMVPPLPPPPPPNAPGQPPTGGSPDGGPGGTAGAAAVPVNPPQSGGPGAAALPPGPGY